MTLTLLLQLTDDEQLYAQERIVEPPAVEATAPALPAEEEQPAAEWPAEAECNG